jgi:hypothetical protein
MEAIHLLFNPSRNIYYNDKNQSFIVRMSSTKDIQKVINFFSFEDHYPLGRRGGCCRLGYKKEQYLD